MDPATVPSQPPHETNGQTNTAATDSTVNAAPATNGSDEPPSKRAKLGDDTPSNGHADTEPRPRVKGVAPIKPEYVLILPPSAHRRRQQSNKAIPDT